MKKKSLYLIATLLLNSKNILTMDPEVTQRIGKQIWQNESSGREEDLTFWSKNESHPSLGIGHNIWLPKGHEQKNTQFPLLCQYLKKNNVALPVWLEESLPTGAPWKNREDFYNDQARLKELRQILVATVALQAQFMVDRLQHTIPKIINTAPEDKREKIAQRIDLMLASPLGTYILVDYLNFKGAGLNLPDQSKGRPWGLLSVLQDMPDDLNQENVTKAFTLSAAKKLIILIEDSEPEYRRIIFFGGWMARLNTYTKKNF